MGTCSTRGDNVSADEYSILIAEKGLGFNDKDGIELFNEFKRFARDDVLNEA